MLTFADLHWVTATGGCSITINDHYAGKSVGCDPVVRLGICYPLMFLWASRFLELRMIIRLSFPWPFL
jgi:hypothetical protein